MHIRLFTWLSVIVVGGLAFVLAYMGTRASVVASVPRPVAPQEYELPSPNEWVPFAAETLVTHHGKERRTRFWRNSAGSTRYESASPDGSETAVTIHNHEQRMSYARIPNGSWAMLPLSLSERQARPRKWKVATPGLSLSPDPPRLGYEVYRYISKSGNVSYLAPDLNFYPLLSESPTGPREEVLSIQRGEPAKELFLPPPAVSPRKAKDTKDLLNVRPEGK